MLDEGIVRLVIGAAEVDDLGVDTQPEGSSWAVSYKDHRFPAEIIAHCGLVNLFEVQIARPPGWRKPSCPGCTASACIRGAMKRSMGWAGGRSAARCLMPRWVNRPAAGLQNRALRRCA